MSIAYWHIVLVPTHEGICCVVAISNSQACLVSRHLLCSLDSKLNSYRDKEDQEKPQRQGLRDLNQDQREKSF